MSHNLLALASTANEAAIAYREALDDADLEWSTSAREHLAELGRRLAGAVDALTGAVVEDENEEGVVVPIDSLTRLREIEDVAGRQGWTVPEAIVALVNTALSGTFLDGYRAAQDDYGIVDEAIVTPPAVPGDGYAQDEPERDEGTTLDEARLVELRATGRARAGRFVDPAVIAECGRVLDRRGETWAASVLGRDISKRSLAVPRRPALREGEEYVLVLADQAEDAAAVEEIAGL